MSSSQKIKSGFNDSFTACEQFLVVICKSNGNCGEFQKKRRKETKKRKFKSTLSGFKHSFATYFVCIRSKPHPGPSGTSVSTSIYGCWLSAGFDTARWLQFWSTVRDFKQHVTRHYTKHSLAKVWLFPLKLSHMNFRSVILRHFVILEQMARTAPFFEFGSKKWLLNFYCGRYTRTPVDCILYIIR